MHTLKTLFFIILTFSSQFLFSYDLGIVSMFRDEAPYLKEWVEYHLLAGANHFYLYCDCRNEDDWKSVLGPYIDEGIVEVIENWFLPDETVHSFSQYQLIAHADALKRNNGSATWLAFIDIDEFLLPMKGSSIPDCLNTYFTDAAAIYVNWRNFGTSQLSIFPGAPLVFELTRCSLKSHPRNSVGKTIVKVECADTTLFSSPHFCPLKKGSYYVNGVNERLDWENNGSEPKLSGVHFDKYIRINHYALRDESFFYGKRLSLAQKNMSAYSVELLWEHYHSFSLTQDTSIQKFIRKNHPQALEKIWKKY